LRYHDRRLTNALQTIDDLKRCAHHGHQGKGSLRGLGVSDLTKNWKAEIHYTNGSTAPYEFEEWEDFEHWLFVGPDHDWSVVVNIVITPPRDPDRGPIPSFLTTSFDQ
jgi:hypothetical protein